MIKGIKRFLLVLVVLVVGLWMFLLIADWDIAPPDVSDFEMVRVEVTAEENAYYYYRQAFSKAQLKDKWEVFGESGLLHEVIEQNREMLRLLEMGNSQEFCQVPEVIGFDTQVPYIAEWMEIGRFLDELSVFLYEDGQLSEALNIQLLKFRFCRKISSHPETFLQSLVGVALLNQSIEQIQNLVVDPEMDPLNLRRISSELKQLPSSSEILVLGLKAEYNSINYEVERLSKGFFRFSKLSALNGGSQNVEFWERIPLPEYVFQPNRTKLLFISASRQVMENLSVVYSEMIDPEEDYLDYHLLINRGMKILFTENAIGNILYHIFLPAMDNVIDLKVKLETRLNATHIMIALQLYQRDHGRYPNTMEDLVPTYLLEIPRDPFDGLDFRYDTGLKIIYAVGKNLKDDGGSLKALDDEEVGEKEFGSLQTEDMVFLFEKE